MQNLPRDEIVTIANNILGNGDILAKHGTSVKNAISIMDTGFDFHRTSYVIQTSKSVDSLCGYGWKENPPGDATNVVIQIPRDFLMDYFGMDDSEYQKFIQMINDDKSQNKVLDYFTTFEYTRSDVPDPNEKFPIVMPPSFKAHIPREFIAGTFIWCNDKKYSTLKDGESALDNLNFVSNSNFYSNLTPEAKQEFIDQMKEELGKEQESRQR